MPYVGRDFDPQDPGEVLGLSFNFTPELGPTETIVSATWTCSAASGSDAAAGSRVVGSTSIAGNVVTAALQNGVAGVNYLHLARAITSAGQTLQLWSHCLCSAPA